MNYQEVDIAAARASVGTSSGSLQLLVVPPSLVPWYGTGSRVLPWYLVVVGTSSSTQYYVRCYCRYLATTMVVLGFTGSAFIVIYNIIPDTTSNTLTY